MICNLTIGATVVELAGGLGRTSETSGLRIDVQPSFERIAYIGVNEARQYARPGASVSVSFDSSQTFATLALAEAYILGLPSDLIDQTSATAVIGHEVPTMVVTGTLSPAAGGTYAFFSIINGRPAYEKGEENVDGYSRIFWDGDFWVFLVVTSYLPTPSVTGWSSSSDFATPDLATSWTASSPATGTPTVTAGTVITPSLTIYDAEANVSAAHQGATVRLSVNLTGRITAP